MLTVTPACAQDTTATEAASTASLKKREQPAGRLKAAVKAVEQQQAALMAAIRDNNTDQVEAISSKALAAAEKASREAKSLNLAKVQTAAEAVASTARELVEIGRQGTIAENSQLLTKLRDEAAALRKSLKQSTATGSGDATSTGTAKAKKAGKKTPQER